MRFAFRAAQVQNKGKSEKQQIDIQLLTYSCGGQAQARRFGHSARRKEGLEGVVGERECRDRGRRRIVQNGHGEDEEKGGEVPEGDLCH